MVTGFTPRQQAFLWLNGREAFFGGAAGGGKSQSLLLAATQYVDVPGYAALLLRRTYADLFKPGALIDRSLDWWSNTDAHWDAVKKVWHFPSGSTISFGYLESERDKFQYQGAEYQFIGFDELTQFSETQYAYLFSRLRRKTGVDIPLRVRSASNPGGLGHEWVKQRFLVEGPGHGRIFVPAKLGDNPYVDREEYEASLMELDPVTRAQLLDGDWDVLPKGDMFQREWFEVVDEIPAYFDNLVRFWDLAATVNTTSAWTAGCLMGSYQGEYYILDVVRFRGDPGTVEENIRRTAERDSKSVKVRMEQEPGSGGVNTIYHYGRHVLPGYDFQGVLPVKSKIARAGPLSSTAKLGLVKIYRGTYLTDYLNELTSFPKGAFKDQVDASSGAFEILNLGPQPRVRRVGR
jgi:predicted phage terminase large subunit-like protein